MDKEQDDLTLVYMWAYKQAKEEYRDRIEALEAALRQICDDPRDADKSYAELFAEVCWEARAALGEKKDGFV
jgi:plasmid stabilization system protein ParE